jgi:hypothetical protein
MAAEFVGPDVVGGLWLLAELYQRRWTDSPGLLTVAAEIRHQEMRFGLSPIDRRRLQWEIEKAEVAEDRTAARRRGRVLAGMAGRDPRDVLKVVE